MSKELNRMQKLAGVPAKKESLNEHQIGGVVGIGAIHTPKREKSYYEEDSAMEEAVGIDASAEAIRGEVRKMIKNHRNDADLGAAVRAKFA